jgi:steroid Delta-isomerase
MTSQTNTVSADARTQALIVFFETLTPSTLAELPRHYASEARFVDPFNDVTGIGAITHVFTHMFTVLDAPRFEVLDTITEGDQCFLLWNFHFRQKGQTRAACIHGSTHVRFAPDGRVQLHRDYWDPARELYETIPLLGGLMRWLRRKLSSAAVH